MPIIPEVMAASTRKRSARRASPEKRAAKQAEELAKTLHSFAAALQSLASLGQPENPKPTPRNWWRLQAGRFKDDPTFAEFVAQVQAARKQEE